MRITQGTFSHLPDLTDDEIEAQLRYALRKATSQLILSKQARKLAEEKRQVRFNFISVLAHELKAPLNAVEGYLNILRATEEDQNLKMIERSIVRVDGMKKLIGDLLDLTRIESGQRERTVKRLDLRELTRASMELFAVDAESRGINMELDADEGIELFADAGEAEIVFNNLISNPVALSTPAIFGSITVALAIGLVFGVYPASRAAQLAPIDALRSE